uniref:Secreted protein n=1 Tax=Loa loa TaxID=7209 RepID=A0A1I7VB93_LOALO
MTKLIVHIAFFIYCQAAAPAAPGGGGQAPNQALGAEITTDYKAEKLWDDSLLMTITKKLEESIGNDDVT